MIGASSVCGIIGRCGRFCTHRTKERRWSLSWRRSTRPVLIAPTPREPRSDLHRPRPLRRCRRRARAACSEIYDGSVEHLRDRPAALRRRRGACRAGCAPATRSCASTPTRVARAPTRGLSYGFVAGPGTLRDDADAARPVRAATTASSSGCCCENHGVELEVGTSTQPIPIHFSFAENDHIEGTLSAERRLLMRDMFDLPDLGAMDDGIANGTYEARAGEAQPLALFTAPRVDYSLHRLRHYTGTAPEQFQNFVLFTNYQFYIDEFVRLGHEAMARRRQQRLRSPSSSRATSITRARAAGAATARRRARRRAAAPAADAGLPPGARRRQRHHDGQHRRRPGQRQDDHRPHRGAAPARLDDARPLRRPAQRRSSSATTCSPTAMCARTTCSTRSCRCGCRSRRWPRSRSRSRRRSPRSRS